MILVWKRLYSMLHAWMREVQEDLYQEEGKKGRHPPASPRYMGSSLHAETGCRKFYAGEVFE